MSVSLFVLSSCRSIFGFILCDLLTFVEWSRDEAVNGFILVFITLLCPVFYDSLAVSALLDDRQLLIHFYVFFFC